MNSTTIVPHSSAKNVSLELFFVVDLGISFTETTLHQVNYFM